MLLWHFVIETQIVNFVARNCGSDAVPEVDLLPTSPDELGDHDGMNAVVLHDVNVFNLVIDLGEATDAGYRAARRARLLDAGRTRDRRRRGPDTLAEPRHPVVDVADVPRAGLVHGLPDRQHAINSFQLDQSVMAAIADLTGDPVFRTWTPVKFPNWLGTTGDVARDLLWHFMVHEYTHTRLLELAESGT